MIEVPLVELRRSFRGGVPAVIATASADGTPNVTYLSTVHLVDDERVAISNQFFSKTSRNLAENPRASILVLDPLTFDEHRLDVVYERTERKGPLFESLRDELDAVAALSGMQDVFRLRSADIYRVVGSQRVLGGAARRGEPPPGVPPALDAATGAARMAELARTLSRAPDLDVLVGATVSGLASLGYEHSLLALRVGATDELFVIASHGYESEGVGSELRMGEGVLGLAAQRGSSIRLGARLQMFKYGDSIRQSFVADGTTPPRGVPVPSLPGGESLLAVPAMAGGEVVGVLAVESTQPVAYDELDQWLLEVVAAIVANAVEVDRMREQTAEDVVATPGGRQGPAADPDAATLRFFPQDGSVFLDGEYLAKGVPGRILRTLVRAYLDEGRVDFTNRELRLDPSLDLPEYRANLESRLILLKRRLDEREAPVRIAKTGRGRFRLVVDAPVRLEPGAG